jgi:hypothetical protein
MFGKKENVDVNIRRINERLQKHDETLIHHASVMRKVVNDSEINNCFKQCPICRKYDYYKNMVELTCDQYNSLGFISFNFGNKFVHTECAKIVPSDDGIGWCRAETHNKTVETNKKGKQ